MLRGQNCRDGFETFAFTFEHLVPVTCEGVRVVGAMWVCLCPSGNWFLTEINATGQNEEHLFFVKCTLTLMEGYIRRLRFLSTILRLPKLKQVKSFLANIIAFWIYLCVKFTSHHGKRD